VNGTSNGPTCITWCYAGSCAGYIWVSNNGYCYCPTSSVNSGTWQ
jgi:hypothetical protein